MIFYILLLFLLGAIIAPGLVSISKRYSGLFLSLISFFILAWVIISAQGLQHGNYILSSAEYLPQIGVSLSFRLDELSYLYLLLICFIGGLIMIYSSFYFKTSRELKYFFPLFSVFTFSMTGLVLSDNAIIFFVFWELTTICSFLLIGFKNRNPEAVKAAWKALVITGTGGFLILAGFLLVGNQIGTFSFYEINRNYKPEDGHLLPLFLIVIGAFTKSAQFPFHTWLPSAMKAPTPVSAFLHSATMVQAGVYLLFRLFPTISYFPEIKNVLVFTGLFTMVMGCIFSVGHKDLKKILAYATIGVLGMVVFLIGLDTEISLIAGLEFVLLHGLYKGGMFLIAGIIDKNYGTRDINELHGLFRTSPVLGTAAILLFCSCAGIFPFLGFFGKELLYQSGLEEFYNEIFVSALFISNSCLVASGVMVGIKPFTGKRMTELSSVKVHPLLNFPSLMLGVAGLVGGACIIYITRQLIETLKHLKDIIKFEVVYWHGFDKVLLISVLTLVFGFLIFRYRKVIQSFCDKIEGTPWLNSNFIYRKFFSGFLALSKLVAKYSLHGYIRWYIFIGSVFFLILGLIFIEDVSISDKVLDLYPYKEFFIYIISGILIISGVVSITSKETLMSIAALGGVGYSLALIFVFLGAPDLAMTQFGIETLTVILFVLAVYRLPKIHHFSSLSIKGLDMLVSLAFGAVITLSVLMVGGSDILSPDSKYFVDNSLKMAHGKNIVNTILVDFRALDTVGEIFVIATAGLGVYCLIRYK